MPDDEINKKIKDAADQYHPAYDDDAWDKMKQLLDEHLPQKKDRRRMIFLLPLLLLLIGGSLTIYYFNTRSSSKIAKPVVSKANAEKSKTESNIATLPKDATASGGNVVVIPKDINSHEKLPANTTDVNTAGTNKIARVPTGKLVQNSDADKKLKRTSTQIGATSNSSIENAASETADQQIPISKPSAENIQPGIAGNSNREDKQEGTVAAEKKETIAANDVDETKSQKKNNINNTQKKTKNNFLNNFTIGLAAGPDVSEVRLSNTGKVTVNYGAELTYSLNQKLTIRTGFYSSNKIYSAGEVDYHAGGGGPGYYNYLESVNANCKIYEVPLSLAYNFRKIKNHNWFIAGGLSSYFMKKESYVYFYKNPSGYTWSRKWAIENKNKHYFSVLDISGGYQYDVSKRFSLRAEPYVKIPLSGIGAGKIKLNSEGILFTAAVKPFK